jgi:nitrate reductase NapD
VQPTERPEPLPGNAPADEWHIAGVVVHVQPGRLDALQEVIAQMSGAEVHATSPAGKMVVTLEAPSPKAIAAQLELLHQMDGVLSAALVYQHGEEAAAMHEEIADGVHPPGLH